MADNKKNAQARGKDEPDFSGFEEENIGFPPYFNFETHGEYIFGVLERYDGRDPEFPRYIFRSSMAIECFQGPKDDRKPITVKKGEQLSISAYGGLRMEVMEELEGIEFKLTYVDDQEVDQPSPMKVFKVAMSPAMKQKLHARRDAIRIAQRKAALAELPEGMRE